MGPVKSLAGVLVSLWEVHDERLDLRCLKHFCQAVHAYCLHAVVFPLHVRKTHGVNCFSLVLVLALKVLVDPGSYSTIFTATARGRKAIETNGTRYYPQCAHMHSQLALCSNSSLKLFKLPT